MVFMISHYEYHKDYYKQYYIDNIDKYRDYYYDNKEYIAKQRKQYYKDNKEKIINGQKAYFKRYYQENKEAITSRCLERYYCGVNRNEKDISTKENKIIKDRIVISLMD